MAASWIHYRRVKPIYDFIHKSFHNKFSLVFYNSIDYNHDNKNT